MDEVEVQPCASIVVPAYRAPHYLDVTLASIMPQAREARAEVIVVSDGPDPANAAAAQRYGATLVTLPVHSGLNTARNAGIDAAGSDVIVFIDQDVEAPPGWLAAVIAGVEGYPQIDVFGGPIRARMEAALPACDRHPPPITTLDAGAADCDVPLVWGANMTMRRSAFDRVGRFDPALLGRGDEEEWLMRWTAAGGGIRYIAAAALDHCRNAADSRLSVLARAAYGQGREVRHHDRRSSKARPLSAELRILAGCAWHTVRRRCAYGIVMGARTAGTIREALAERRA